MQVFFGFLWNLPLSSQNFRLIVLPFSAFPAGIRTFLPSRVSDTAAVGLQGRKWCRRLAAINLLKRTFCRRGLNWLSEREYPTKPVPALRSLTHPKSLATCEKPGPSIQQKRGARHSDAWASTQRRGHPLACVSVPSPHSWGFSSGRCGCDCAVMTGYLPSYAGVTFITLRCGSCSIFYKYLKIPCMGDLKLGLLPSDAWSRKGCFELDLLVCSHWVLRRMIFSFPLLHTVVLGL